MVKKLAIFLMFLSAAFPAIASAGEFTATVDRNSDASGENFTLELALSNAKAKDAPDTTPLSKSFIIASQGQSSNTTIINGSVTTSTGWELTLIPKTVGNLTIPPISIETSDGTLITQPITMDVGKASALPSQSQNGQTTITAHASTLNPYKGQPIFYTVKIVARGNVADLSLDDLKVENAIVENQGKPRISDAEENGRPVKVIETRYIITPLDSGKITIPPVLLQGRMEVEGHDPIDDAFRQMDSDPFSMLQHMNRMGGFMNVKPFSLASNEVQLDVKPAAAAIDPWLPLTSLKIQENLDDTQGAKVGEPINRKITLVADGATGKQLPSLEPQQNNGDFKVYADKPVTEESIKGDSIIGTRKESYSLIPLKSGKLVLPEIKVPWWDIRNNRIAYASLPARTIDVLPGLAVQGQTPASIMQQPAPAVEQQSAASPEARPPVVAPQTSWKIPPVLYAAIGVLFLMLLSAVFWAIRLQRRVSSLSESKESNTIRREPEIAIVSPCLPIRDITSAKSAQELNSYLRDYAHEHWGTAKNATLEGIFSNMVSQGRLQKESTEPFAKAMVAALYAGKEVDLPQLKKQCSAIIDSVRKAGNDNMKAPEKLPKLNPS
jgi:hypothetical protein